MKSVVVKAATAAMLLLLSASCSDWRDGIDPDAARQEGIAFQGYVAASRQQGATRADGSLVNLHEYSLPSTKKRTYFRADAEGNVPEEGIEAEYYAGIFGCYTGKYSWAELVKLAKKVSESSEPSESSKQTLTDYYTAGLLFNQQAAIGEPTGNVNTLDYSPQRLWPNEKFSGGAGGYRHGRVTFFAYYPYNPTELRGDYGINISPDSMAPGRGMGSVTFTMNPDAAQQNDFLISRPVTDCTRDVYGSHDDEQPRRVSFQFYHMLAQVRLYAFIRGTDKMVYKTDPGTGEDSVATAEWLARQAPGYTIRDAYGNVYTVRRAPSGGNVLEQTTRKEAFPGDDIPDLDGEALEALGMRIPDEAQCLRWDREGGVWDVTHARRRANITYRMELRNIKTSATFFPKYDAAGNFTSLGYYEGSTLGWATVNHYIMNPYWFRFDEAGQRYQLNDNYMYGYYEDTPAYHRSPDYASTVTGDGIDWSDYTSEDRDPLHYLTGVEEIQKKELQDPDNSDRHYNFYPGNILMVVPQQLRDDDVPHIVITAVGHNADRTPQLDGTGNPVTARVTINLLNMGLKWESGFIYSYAFIDELRPGDDKVQGPESIIVPFDPDSKTNQW